MQNAKPSKHPYRYQAYSITKDDNFSIFPYRLKPHTYLGFNAWSMRLKHLLKTSNL